MPTFETKLQELAREIAQLQEQAAAASPAVADRYAEGYAAGWRDHHAATLTAIRNALNSVALDPGGVSSAPQSTDNSHATRLSAPTKDQLVRQYLAAHPGVRYRDMNRDLPPYVATRVYALEKRGEVRKDAEGRFHLTSHGAPDGQSPNGERD